MPRFLLPFTFGVEMDLLEALVHFTADQDATLIPLSLIPQPAGRRKGPRLELLQQSQDFLEAVRSKARRYSVTFEPVEVFTGDIVHSILAAVEEFRCDGILLASRTSHSSLVSDEVRECLLQVRPCTLFLIHFPSKRRARWRALGWASAASWWCQWQGKRATRRGVPSVAHASHEGVVPQPGETQAEQQEVSRDAVSRMERSHAAIE